MFHRLGNLKIKFIYVFLLAFVFLPGHTLAIKFRMLGNYEGFYKNEIDADFRSFQTENGDKSSSQTEYFGSTIAEQNTKLNRVESYHLILEGFIGLGYTALPMEHRFKLSNGNEYIRDLRINEYDLSLVLGGEGGNLTIGKGFRYGTSTVEGDSSFFLLGYSIEEAKKIHEAVGLLPKLATLEILVGYRSGKYYVFEEAIDFNQNGTEEWRINFKVYLIGLGARF